MEAFYMPIVMLRMHFNNYVVCWAMHSYYKEVFTRFSASRPLIAGISALQPFSSAFSASK